MQKKNLHSRICQCLVNSSNFASSFAVCLTTVPNVPKSIVRHITSLLKKGVKFVFTSAMETIVLEVLLTEISAPSILVFPGCVMPSQRLPSHPDNIATLLVSTALAPLSTKSN